ncbi:phosphatidylinositol-glycan biosynthesis class S protein [Biscogniauxia mediterranea]|nr:phosphatidylinositol-glycan biosynthesis class S protein [Biscogniauxia mediterranea]
MSLLSEDPNQNPKPNHGTVEVHPAPSSGEETTTTMTTTASTTTSKRKQPPPETPSHIRRRSFIIASFWAIVLFLGLPIWWKTTTIYRADLPLNRMMDWADGKACSPEFPIRVAIDAPGVQANEAENLVRATQQVLDNMQDFPGHRIRLEIPETSTDHAAAGLIRDSDTALIIRLKPGDVITTTLHPHLPILEVTYPPDSVVAGTSAASSLSTYLATELRSTFAEEQAIMSYLLATSSIPSERRPQDFSQHITESLSKRMTRSLKYSRTYHLTFSLFTSGPSPNSWEIESAVHQYMKPVLNMLSSIHNFTIDTQVQLYATPGVQSQVLTKEDLSSFINAAEWPLSPSIGGAPTVNFVVYIGNQTIGTGSESETSQSWLIPQWGSVYLLSPPPTDYVPAELLKQPILTFTSHLLSLLGTPQSGSLPMRLSTLTRIRSADLLLRASSSLGSLARLSLALPSISIPPSVADGVAKSMHHLELACASTSASASSSTRSSSSGFEHARIAEEEAERAFFEKSMVGQLYFPDEHKIAVYLPLLGPVGVPLLMGLLNEVRAWRKRRGEKVKGA